MNRRERRRAGLTRPGIRKGRSGALLAAQALSREELATALANWAGLAGASNFGPYTVSQTVTNRLDDEVTVVADIRIYPAAEAPEKGGR